MANATGVKAFVVPVKRTGRYVSNRLDIHLSSSCAQRLRDVFDGLYESKAQLKDGKYVEKPQQAVQWLLENIPTVELSEK